MFIRLMKPALALVLALPLGACAKRAPHGETRPAERADMEAAGIDVIEAELAAREGQLQAVGVRLGGVALAGGDSGAGANKAEATRDLSEEHHDAEKQAAPVSAPTSATPSGPGPSRRCETICELSASICQLRDNICALAPRHTDEPRYQLACDRAAQDCTLSSEACHACS